MNLGTWRDKRSARLSMIRGRRQKHYTIRQRLEILRELELPGSRVVEVSEQYGVHPRTLYRWKKELKQEGEETLEGRLFELSLRAEELERENQMLKDTLIPGSLSELNLRANELERENQILKDTVISLSQDIMLLKKKMSLV
jgi:transposase-like protein